MDPEFKKKTYELAVITKYTMLLIPKSKYQDVGTYLLTHKYCAVPRNLR